MTTLREAAHRLLTAIDAALPHAPLRGEFDFVSDTADDLKAALAEPVQDWSMLNATQDSLREHMAEIHRLRAALAEQDVPEADCGNIEPVQEPVAWMVYTKDGKSVCVTDNPADFTDQHRALPLYTSPPQRKPLSYEEIDALAMDENDLPNSHIEFARAIEQAHGIGSKT